MGVQKKKMVLFETNIKKQDYSCINGANRQQKQDTSGNIQSIIKIEVPLRYVINKDTNDKILDKKCKTVLDSVR